MLKLPPPIWTLIFLIVAAAISFALGWPKVPGLPLPPLGIALVVVAFIPPVWAAGLFRREGTEIDPTSSTNRVLVTRGPYRFTRNPMYLGLITFALGIAIWIGAWPMFLAPIAVFATTNFVHIPFEETKMRRQFGAAYEDYLARVGRWLCESAALEVVTRTTAQLRERPILPRMKHTHERFAPGATKLGSCLTDATRGDRARRNVRVPCRYAADRTDDATIIAAL